MLHSAFHEKVCDIVMIFISAAVLIDFDDCPHHNEYEKWVTNIYIWFVLCHTFNINS